MKGEIPKPYNRTVGTLRPPTIELMRGHEVPTLTGWGEGRLVLRALFFIFWPCG